MKSVAQRSAEEALRRWGERVYDTLPADAKIHAEWATEDLFSGPLERSEERPDWRGFSHACDVVRDALADVPGELWVDWDCGIVYDSAPEAYSIEGESGEIEWIEPDWDVIYHVPNRRDVLSFVIPPELAIYVV